MTKHTDMPEHIWCFLAQADEEHSVTSDIYATKRESYGGSIQYTRTDTIAEKDRVMQVMAEALAVGANYSGPQTKDIMKEALAEYAKIKD